MKIAFVFPGQGSQAIAMGKELYDNFAIAKETFEEVDDVLNRKLSKLIFEGDIDELTLTYNAQPAIMVASIAVVRVIEKELGKKLTEIGSCFAGHSLGEYSAHFVCETFSLSSSAKLLEVRGKAMHEAALAIPSKMVALLGCELGQVEALVSKLNETGLCDIANDNGAGQFVISGSITSMDEACRLATEFGIKRTIPLNVSGAFHSRIMQSAQDKLKAAIYTSEVSAPKAMLIANFTVDKVNSVEDVRATLTNQVTGTVRWRQTMDRFAQNGITHIFEFGPGKVLSTIAKRMYPDINSTSILTIDEVEAFLKNF